MSNDKFVKSFLNGCLRKKRFDTADKAMKAAKNKKVKLSVYYCRSCNGFHITSSKSKWKSKVS